MSADRIDASGAWTDTSTGVAPCGSVPMTRMFTHLCAMINRRLESFPVA
jgi:hypothetical protein